MIIPEDVNFIEFYYKAKEKGIKIRSRYKGVYVGTANDNRDIVWMAQFRIKRKAYYKIFPFTKDGEIKAAKAWEELSAKYTKISE